MPAQPEGLLTIAYGQHKYIKMAQALALSYRRYKPSRPFAIVTDSANASALKPYFDIVIIANPEYGSGVVQKLHVDLYSPFTRTLFVDSDCLFYKDPDDLWQLYAHGPFSIRGWRYLTGETDYEKGTPYQWVRNTSQFLKLNRITRLAHFNGGVFYFDSSDTSHKLFRIARSLYEGRAAYGFIPFKGAPLADEPVMAVAMEQCGISMDHWDSVRGMETAIGMKKSMSINVLKGESGFLKDDTHRNPALIHFNMDAQDGLIYNRDVYRLLYEQSTFRSLLVAMAMFKTCILFSKMRLLRFAGNLPSRLRRGESATIAERLIRPLI